MRSLHLRAVAYFEAAGDIDRAIDHCRVSGAVEKLIDLVEQAAPAHLARGRSRTVQGWLETVPAEILAGRPWLMLYRGTILAMHGQSDAARLLLLQTREAFTAAGDELGEGRALNQLCRVAFFEGRYEEALELNHEAPRRMAWTDHEGRSRAFREQAELWIYLGRPMQAIEESLVHTQHLSDKAVMAERTIIQGVAYRIAGRLSEAMRTMKRGLNMLDTPEALGSTLLTHNWGWPIWSVGS